MSKRLPRVSLFRNFIPESEERANSPDRLQLTSDTLFPLLIEHREMMGALRQVKLKDESEFLRWTRQLGVSASGSYPSGDGTELWIRGWLRADAAKKESRSAGTSLAAFEAQVCLDQPIGTAHKRAGRWSRYDLTFHPFRIYPLLRILDSMKWNLTRTSIFHPQGVERHAKRHVQWFKQWQKHEEFLPRLNWFNGVADLAILLEPIYWPKMTHVTSRSMYWDAPARAEEYELMRNRYTENALAIAEQILKAKIAEAHMSLRYDAARLDENTELYLLLRCCEWAKREKITGALGAALWLRHMAEVLRHAYDELYDDRLVHEDESGSRSVPGARKWIYGSEYPLENEREFVKRTLPRWGITSSPRVRIYVEGETEAGAFEEGLGAYLGSGIEIVNMRAEGWGTWLAQQLKLDVEAKRKSIIMLDGDQENPLRCLRSHCKEQLIVGMIFVNKPDMEFGCFTMPELVTALHYYEESQDYQCKDRLDLEQFLGVETGRALMERYVKLRHAPSPKGKAWGAALMRVAFENDVDESNRLKHAWACAIRAVTSDYEVMVKNCAINCETLENEKFEWTGFE